MSQGVRNVEHMFDPIDPSSSDTNPDSAGPGSASPDSASPDSARADSAGPYRSGLGVAGSGFGLGCELGVVAQQGAGGLVALANLVAGVGSSYAGNSSERRTRVA